MTNVSADLVIDSVPGTVRIKERPTDDKKKSKNLSAFYLFYKSALLNQYKRDLISPLTLSNED